MGTPTTVSRVVLSTFWTEMELSLRDDEPSPHTPDVLPPPTLWVTNKGFQEGDRDRKVWFEDISIGDLDIVIGFLKECQRYLEWRKENPKQPLTKE